MKAAVLAVVVAGAAMGMGATVQARIPAAIPVNAPNYGREADVLKEAYATLEKADHDYKGHRREAMNHIEKACDLLGQPIKGDGRGRQPQPVSDTELKEAQHKVQMVRQYIGSTQPAIASQLDEAIKQIGIALTVK